MQIFHTIKINTKMDQYDILFGEDLLSHIHEINAIATIKPTKILIVTDDQVGPLYSQKLLEAIGQLHIENYTYTIKNGEPSKSLTTYEQVIGFMLEHGFDRKSLLLALGGGVVGDLCGFVAATFMRGIPYIQVPSTILAHDSSVGGKVAINHQLGKNTIGAFHQPQAVIYDVGTLQSLPKHEIASGIAEVVKHGHIHSPELNTWLKEHYHQIEQLDNATIANMLYQSCLVKAEIVQQDEKEEDVRAFLNFGHTVAHGIEGAMGYGKIPHGIAVAIGMVSAAILGYRKGMTTQSVLQHVIDVNRVLNLPIHLPESITNQEIIDYIMLDKKNIGGQLTFVLLKDVGKPEIVRGITIQEVNEMLNEQRVLK